MNITTHNKIAHVEQNMAPLVGGTIRFAVGVEDEFTGDVFPVLQVIATDGTVYQIEVACDSEGNGPGHLAIHAVD